MRVNGEKLSREQLAVARAFRGELSVRTRLDAQRGRDVLVAMLASEAFELLLPVLDHARLGPLRGDSIMLYGIEEAGGQRSRREYPQAWWCTLAREPVPSAAYAPRHDDEEVDTGVMLDAATWAG